MASRQANDAIASERGLDARGGRKLRTDTHTHAGQPQYITIIIHYDSCKTSI